MKTNRLTLILVICVLLSTACKKDKNAGMNCGILHTALLNKDSKTMNAEINKLAQDLTPNPDFKNVNILVDRLNAECAEIRVKNLSGVIETFPPISEIRITMDSAEIQIERVVDIVVPENKPLQSTRVH